MIRHAILLLLGIWAVHLFAVHKFHASLTQIEFNAETGTAEVAMRLFIDDLENSLSKQVGVSIALDQDREMVIEETLKYIKKVLLVKGPKSAAYEPTWVGMEYDVHVVWVYVEFPVPKNIQSLEVMNRVFFDQFQDQVNTVNLKSGKKKETLVFRFGDSSKTVNL